MRNLAGVPFAAIAWTLLFIWGYTNGRCDLWVPIMVAVTWFVFFVGIMHRDKQGVETSEAKCNEMLECENCGEMAEGYTVCPVCWNQLAAKHHELCVQVKELLKAIDSYHMAVMDVPMAEWMGLHKAIMEVKKIIEEQTQQVKSG